MSIIKNVYTEFRTATIAAVEYVCYKFKHYPWFNHQLKRHLSELHTNHSLRTFHPPLIIYAYRNENDEQLAYSGYHFLISEMEKYERIFAVSKWFTTLLWGYCFCVILTFILTIHFITRSKQLKLSFWNNYNNVFKCGDNNSN